MIDGLLGRLRRGGRRRPTRVFGPSATTASIASRLDEVFADLVRDIDALRRGHIDAPDFLARLGRARPGLSVLQLETAEAAPEEAVDDDAACLRSDLERAMRGIDMVEHGALAVPAGRGRGREREVQTAVRRGYLNLLHARDAIRRHMEDD